MEEKSLKIQGEITRIFCPKDGDFGFEDSQWASFLAKTKEYGTILCNGETFPIFAGENIIMEGKLISTEKGQKLNFNSIKTDLKSEESAKKYFCFICGAGTYKRLVDAIIINSGRTFENEKQKDDYANEKIEEYLNDENHSILRSIPGIGEKTALKLISKYKENMGFEKAYIELSNLGLTLKDCSKIIRNKGLKKYSLQEIVKIIKSNPYRLMDLVDFSFSKCDILHFKREGAVDSKCRVFAAIVYSIKEELGKGHAFSSFKLIHEKTSLILNKSVDSRLITNCFDYLIKINKLVADGENIYFNYIFDLEQKLREYVKKALSDKNQCNKDYSNAIVQYEKEEGITFGVEQKKAISNSLKSKVSVITGGPGTGKTSCLAGVIKILLKEDNVREDEIALCAPTGKAAKRMMESINGALGTDMIAKTIHSLLEVNPDFPDLDVFIYNEKNKLRKKAIIIDEASMIDLKIATALIDAIPENCKVILLGDRNQLLPVGCSYFLRDIIESHITCTMLNEIHRQKAGSTIIELASAIEKDSLTISNLEKKNDFLFVNIDSAKANYKETMEKIVNIFLASVKKIGLEETMILTPINGEVEKENSKKSQRFGAQQISLAIQETLLPSKEGDVEFEKNGWKFKIGSKVIVTKNDNSKQIVNGQIGYIESIDKETKKIDVDFEGRTVTLEEENIDNLRLAYAITVHKSQGSEWANVIYCCFEETSMNKKALVYTAITRAKKNLVIVGSAKTFLNSPKNLDPLRRSRIFN